ncbi:MULTISPECIES: ABC transporter ATP-binding protein [Bacillus]|uniref:Bacitracin ABC transporter ATP-binding protein n=2 Tax=Bacillus TaxID=1386 RepID=A0A0M5JEL0_9BACI|nr:MULTISPECIES: ABC transporter ATP-binding protein [Bacillus]ALC82931.1 bacitracin ABC transporter ATP-binding protein [Bacillus gobiensis]MBP1081914.1 ABC-2 type transport system ATP-binding protein [Bacillus capparidis]MED1096561.1 ABC transporter ATP-binding protein [Bacillus capparidis]
MEMIVQTKNLTKRFGQELAVKGIDLSVKKGEIYGFLGANGAGKTTTIRMLLGLLNPTHGSVEVFGQDIQKNKLTILGKVGSLVESPSYYGHLTAEENLETLRKVLNQPKRRIQEVLAIVGLSNTGKKKVKGFSLGMKQRLGLAAALLREPELLILDEPTNGLDPQGIIEIRELIKRLPKEQNMTVIISSHLLSEIDQMATSVGVISKGELIFQDSIAVLRKQAGQMVQLRVSDPKNAANILLSHGIEASVQQGVLRLPESPDEKIAKIVKLLSKHDVSIYRVEEEKRSLEDIFLNMTKEEKSA